MATVSNSADINIRVGGSTPSTITARANALQRLAGSLVTMNSALNLVGASAGAAGGIGRLNTQLRNYGASGGAAHQAQRRTDAFGTALRDGGNALDNFATLFTRMIRIMTAFFIIQNVTRAVREFVTSLFQAPAQMELWGTQLRVLVGNATAAGEKLKLLQDVAIESPQNLKDLVEGLVTLTAFHVETSQRTLSLITDLSAVTGRSFREVAQVVGKVIQGSPQAITRSLPVLGIDPQEFKRVAAETGSRATALFQIIEQKFKGFAAESTNTILGLVEKIKDTFFVLMSTLGSGLIPIMRETLGGIFEFANRLRQDPAAMEQYRVKVRLLAEDLLAMGRNAATAAGFIKRLWDFAGGLHTALTVLAGLGIARLIAALINMNKIGAVVTIAFGAFVTLVGHLGKEARDAKRAIDEMTMSNKMFGESLAEISKMAGTDISRVDANVAAGQATRLRSLAMEGNRDNLMAALGPLVGEDVVEGTFTKDLSRWANIFAANFDRIAARARSAMGIVSNAMGEIEDGLDAHEEWLTEINKDWAEASELIDAAMKMQSNWLAIVNEQWKEAGAHFDLFQSMRDEFVRSRSGFGEDEFALIQVDEAAGLISPAAARTAALMLRDRLAEELKRLRATGDPVDAEIAIAIQGRIENVDAFAEGLRSKVSEALEISLRDVVKDGANAISDALASMIVSVEGSSLADSFKAVLAGFLNTFGDALIQLGIAKLAFDELISKIIGFVPGGGLAAIAAGLALKAFAGAITNSIRNSQNGATGRASSAGAGAPAPAYQAFTPSGGQNAVVQYNYISAVDSKSMKEYVERNPDAFTPAVRHVKDSDRRTGGSAFGVFAPAGARG